MYRELSLDPRGSLIAAQPGMRAAPTTFVLSGRLESGYKIWKLKLGDGREFEMCAADLHDIVDQAQLMIAMQNRSPEQRSHVEGVCGRDECDPTPECDGWAVPWAARPTHCTCREWFSKRGR